MRWVTRGDNADFNALGRHTNSPDANGKITNTIRTKLTFLSNYLLSEDNIPRRDELLQLKSDIEEDITINKHGNTSKNYVTGNKYFWNSDLMAHHRNNYSSILLPLFVANDIELVTNTIIIIIIKNTFFIFTSDYLCKLHKSPYI